MHRRTSPHRKDSLSLEARRIDIKGLNSNKIRSSRFSSTIESKQLLSQNDPVNEYYGYMLRTKTLNVKKNYSVNLDENIKKIQNFNRLAKIQQDLADREAALQLSMAKSLQKAKREEAEKKEAERIRIEQEKAKEEKRIKEIIKEKGLKEWMDANSAKFDQEKRRIKQGLQEALDAQRQNAEKKRKVNQARHAEILNNLETSRQISRNIMLINLQRDSLLKLIQEREAKELADPPEKVIAVNCIQERLNFTQTLDYINKCFQFESADEL